MMMCDCLAGSAERSAANVLAQAFPASPVAVDDKSLDNALGNYSPFVLDCWEKGCRPCELIDPKINQMAEDFRGRIVFGKLCTNYNPAAVSKYGVSRTPTLLVFKNGSLVYKHVGNYPIGDLEHMILTVLHMR
jgi:thioredoxin 1